MPVGKVPDARTVRLEIVVVLVPVTAIWSALSQEKLTPALVGIGTGVVPFCVSSRLKVIPVSAFAPGGSEAEPPKNWAWTVAGIAVASYPAYATVTWSPDTNALVNVMVWPDTV